jgi:hypothetical protein
MSYGAVDASDSLGTTVVVVVVASTEGHAKLPPTLTKGIEYLNTTYPDIDTVAPGVHENPITN